MRFGSTAIHADFFQDTKRRVYVTSICIQNKDSNEEVFPSDPSVWSMNWDCIDSLTEILVGNLLTISLGHWIFLIYLLLPSCCKSKNAANTLSTWVLRYILNTQQLIKLNNCYCILTKSMPYS